MPARRQRVRDTAGPKFQDHIAARLTILARPAERAMLQPHFGCTVHQPEVPADDAGRVVAELVQVDAEVREDQPRAVLIIDVDRDEMRGAEQHRDAVPRMIGPVPARRGR